MLVHLILFFKVPVTLLKNTLNRFFFIDNGTHSGPVCSPRAKMGSMMDVKGI